jgi:glycosyltransferase involved in cell wall biosynthesis
MEGELRMRIGIVAPPWVSVPPGRYGGTESVVDRLARGFIAAGHDVFLWTTGDSTCPVPKGWVLERSEGDRMGIAAIELRHLIRGYEAMVEWGADIVHDHTLIGPVYAQRYPRLPVVTTNHGPFNEELTDLYRAVAEDVPVIAISHDHAARADGLPVAAVIHHGIDLDAFPVGDGSGDDHGDYLLFLGRMAPEKGARRAALAAKQAGARLVMAAKMREPLERDFFEQQVRPLLDEQITYIGEVGGPDKLRLLQGARALVNPIRWPEPFGLVMIEALACGTPVLAFAEGSAPELIDHGTTGYLCEDVDDLARRIGDVSLIDRAACREAAVERFSTQRMVDQHLSLFQRVIAERGATRGLVEA